MPNRGKACLISRSEFIAHPDWAKHGVSNPERFWRYWSQPNLRRYKLLRASGELLTATGSVLAVWSAADAVDLVPVHFRFLWLPSLICGIALCIVGPCCRALSFPYFVRAVDEARRGKLVHNELKLLPWRLQALTLLLAMPPPSRRDYELQVLERMGYKEIEVEHAGSDNSVEAINAERSIFEAKVHYLNTWDGVDVEIDSEAVIEYKVDSMGSAPVESTYKSALMVLMSLVSLVGYIVMLLIYFLAGGTNIDVLPGKFLFTTLFYLANLSGITMLLLRPLFDTLTSSKLVSNTAEVELLESGATYAWSFGMTIILLAFLFYLWLMFIFPSTEYLLASIAVVPVAAIFVAMPLSPIVYGLVRLRSAFR